MRNPAHCIAENTFHNNMSSTAQMMTVRLTSIVERATADASLVITPPAQLKRAMLHAAAQTGTETQALDCIIYHASDVRSTRRCSSTTRTTASMPIPNKPSKPTSSSGSNGYLPKYRSSTTIFTARQSSPMRHDKTPTHAGIASVDCGVPTRTECPATVRSPMVTSPTPMYWWRAWRRARQSSERMHVKSTRDPRHICTTEAGIAA